MPRPKTHTHNTAQRTKTTVRNHHKAFIVATINRDDPCLPVSEPEQRPLREAGGQAEQNGRRRRLGRCQSVPQKRRRRCPDAYREEAQSGANASAEYGGLRALQLLLHEEVAVLVMF